MDRALEIAKSPMGLDSNHGAIRAIYTVEGALCFVHGAVGCSFNARLLYSLHDNEVVRLTSSMMEGEHVIYGGEELLEKALLEASEAYRPELIVIQNTCIPLLIGDDSAAVARKVAQQTGVKIISTNNPNYEGKQLDGFQNVLKAYIGELMDPSTEIRGKSVNLLGVIPGEYNWRRSLREAVRILNSLGLSVNCVLVGEATTVGEIKGAPKAEANVLFYPEVGLPAARLMEERFGIPYIDTVFPPIGIESTREWILKITEFFDLTKEGQAFIEREMEAMGGALAELEKGQLYNLQFLFGKTYALAGAPYQIPAMVKFLCEDLSMVPTTIAFHEYDPSSFSKLEGFLRKEYLSVEVQTDGDHLQFLEAIKKGYQHPYGDPWLVFGSTLDALHLAFSGVALPVVRFSYPVYDQAIITDRSFAGFRGVVSLVEEIHNTLNLKLSNTGCAFGLPNPFAVLEKITPKP